MQTGEDPPVPQTPPKAPKSVRKNRNAQIVQEKDSLNYEEECERRLKAVPIVDEGAGVTDLTSPNSRPTSSQSGRGRVTFTDQSQVHEIPPKPKRTRHPEKRSKSAPNKLISDSKEEETAVDNVVVENKLEAVELCQRASVTSIDDLKLQNRNVPEKDIEALNKVYNNQSLVDMTVEGQSHSEGAVQVWIDIDFPFVVSARNLLIAHA